MKNKKGMFFLMVTILIVSLFVLSLSFFSNYAERKVIQERVESLSNFVTATESDLHRQIFISGYRAIFFMEREIVERNQYISNTRSLMDEMFFNGTIYGQSEQLLQTFSEIKTSISRNAAEVNAEVVFANSSITLTQEDPWHVVVVFTSDFYVSDDGNLASWNKTLVVRVPIALSNFTDPIYLKGTEGYVNPVIVKTPYSNFPDDLNAHVLGKFYREHEGAPSFLDRLEGNFTGSVYGIESLVYVPDIPTTPKNYQTGLSIVDYIYFEGSDFGCEVSGGMDSWVRLDDPHTVYYGVSCL